VGVCIWLAKFLRMSRPGQTTRKADAAEVPGQRYPSITRRPTSTGSYPPTRPQLPSTSVSSKKSSSTTSKKLDIFQQRSSRSLLANVLDLEDDFLLLNFSTDGATRSRVLDLRMNLSSFLTRRRNRQEWPVSAIRMSLSSFLRGK